MQSVCLSVMRFGHWVCGESWHASHRPSSQGLAPGVLPLCVCVFGGSSIYLYLGGGFVGGGSGFFLLYLASIL